MPVDAAAESTTVTPGKITVVTIQAIDLATGKLVYLGESRWNEVKDSGTHNFQNRVVETFSTIAPRTVATARPTLQLKAPAPAKAAQAPKAAKKGCGCGG